MSDSQPPFLSARGERGGLHPEGRVLAVLGAADVAAEVVAQDLVVLGEDLRLLVGLYVPAHGAGQREREQRVLRQPGDLPQHRAVEGDFLGELRGVGDAAVVPRVVAEEDRVRMLLRDAPAGELGVRRIAAEPVAADVERAGQAAADQLGDGVVEPGVEAVVVVERDRALRVALPLGDADGRLVGGGGEDGEAEGGGEEGFHGEC